MSNTAVPSSPRVVWVVRDLFLERPLNRVMTSTTCTRSFGATHPSVRSVAPNTVHVSHVATPGSCRLGWACSCGGGAWSRRIGRGAGRRHVTGGRGGDAADRPRAGSGQGLGGEEPRHRR